MNWRIHVNISRETLFPFLIYNKPIQYNEQIRLYPVTMNDIVLFQALSEAITVRKNSTFREKKIIKMTYLDFLIYCFGNTELEEQYKLYGLSKYLLYSIQLLQLCCKDSEVKVNQRTWQFYINNELVTPQIFDDLRKIIIIQNGIDFNIDEFLNYDTEQRLLKAESDNNKNKNNVNIEDYIDSLAMVMNITEDKIMEMTIRKFWRYIKRYQLYENYTIAKTGECSGMVKYKEPIKHWIISLEENDKYEHLKTDEAELKGKIG